MKPRTGKPKSAPFMVGTRLRYLGQSQIWEVVDGKRIPLMEPGMLVTIVDIHEGHQGTGRVVYVDDIDGEPVYDTTRDAISVCQNQYGRQRLIRREEAHEWKIIKPGDAHAS